MTEDEMLGWHHQHDGHEFEQAPGGLVRCSPWSLKESDMTERLSNKNKGGFPLRPSLPCRGPPTCCLFTWSFF